MSQLLQLTAYEIRLYLRNKTFWLMGLLAVATAVIPTINFLLIQFIAISAITRDERSGFAKILPALPYNTIILFLARALAVFCLLLAMWPFMVAVAGFWGGTGPAEWLFNANQLAFLTLKYITLSITATGFVFLAGTVTRQSFWLYCLIGTCWVVDVCVTSNIPHFPAWSKLFIFGHGIILPVAPSTAVGYFPQQDLLPGFAAFQGAMAILFLLCGAVRQMRKRGELILQSKMLVSLVLIAVTVGVTAGGFVGWELDNRKNGFRAGLRELKKSEPVIAKTMTSADPELASYHLSVKLRTTTRYLAGTATLNLKLTDNPSNFVFFTLRNCFAVDNVFVESSGEQLEWRRDGSRLAVRVPERYWQDKSITLTISYSGKVWEWFTAQAAHPQGLVNFVDPAFSLLRSGYAWYPIPGDHPLYTREYYMPLWDNRPKTTLWAKRAVHSPVPFQLTVDIDTDNMVASNLEQVGMEVLSNEYKRRYRFSSIQGRDVFLLAGPYYRAKRAFPGRKEFVEVYCYHQHRGRIDDVLKSMTAPYLFYEDMLQANYLADPVIAQSGKICTVVEVPPFLYLTEVADHLANITLTDTVLIPENYFRTDKKRLEIFTDTQESGLRYSSVLQRWWYDDIMVDDNSKNNIDDGLGLYLVLLYVDGVRGSAFDEPKQSLLTAAKKNFPLFYDSCMVLDAIKTATRDDMTIKKIMRKLYQVRASEGKISPATFAHTVREVLPDIHLTQAQTNELNRRLENIMHSPEDRIIKPGFSLIINFFYPEEWL